MKTMKEKGAYARAWRQANRIKVAKQRLVWRLKNKDKLAKQRHAYYMSHRKINKAKTLKRARTWYRKNKIKAAKTRRDYYLNNKNKVNAYLRVWRSANKALIAAWSRAYRLRNPDKVAERSRIRRARKLKAKGSHTRYDIDRLYFKQRGRCASPHCRVSLASGYHVDHKTPLSRGGLDYPRNLQLMCAPCNIDKGARTMKEWISL